MWISRQLAETSIRVANRTALVDQYRTAGQCVKEVDDPCWMVRHIPHDKLAFTRYAGGRTRSGLPTTVWTLASECPRGRDARRAPPDVGGGG
jgi:hypothetical protein